MPRKKSDKGIQDLYSKKQNKNKNLIERYTNGDLFKWRDIPSSWIRRFNIVEMCILLH